jgi:hypothetical protein
MRCAMQGKEARRRRQYGWGASEYLAVLLGLMVVWRGAEAVLELIREHHDRFAWALMIPY